MEVDEKYGIPKLNTELKKKMEHELNSWIFIVYYYSTQHNEFIYVKKDQANKEKYDCI
jgi:hypothetical protein